MKKQIIKIVTPYACDQKSAQTSNFKSVKINSPIPEIVTSVHDNNSMNSLVNSTFYPQYEVSYLQV